MISSYTDQKNRLFVHGRRNNVLQLHCREKFSVSDALRKQNITQIGLSPSILLER